MEVLKGIDTAVSPGIRIGITDTLVFVSQCDIITYICICIADILVLVFVSHGLLTSYWYHTHILLMFWNTCKVKATLRQYPN